MLMGNVFQGNKSSAEDTKRCKWEEKNYQNDFEQKGEEYFGLLKHLFFLNPKLLEGDF